ncbi:P-type DNA transfer ATPase VirB11 [Stenotrophomonas maltophilia]|uniref:P-type DNA transfer ATPase VirB11 n=1 Tax=Stenotrophomonas maltophilia TaxID=40324 RepID=UPI00313EB384
MTSRQSNAMKGDETLTHLMEPLNKFLNDEAITEICVNRPGEVFVESGSRWSRHEVPELSFQYMMDMAVAAAVYKDTKVSRDKPLLSAKLPGGERCQFVVPSACEDGTVSLTIRRPSLDIRRLDNYSEAGFFDHVMPITHELSSVEMELLKLKNSKQYEEFMRLAVMQEKVIVVAGATGSGKTTFMRALLQEVPTESRCITIEDVHELFMPNHPNRVHLMYPADAPKDAVITPTALLRSCLRMKPDRIFLAELRGGETFDFINMCASGHGGSITSVHAGSAALAFERLALMILQNEMGRTLPYDVIMRMLYMVVDVVIHVHNDTTGLHGRHITEVWYDPSRKRYTNGAQGQVR